MGPSTSSPPFQREKEALARLLSSGVFLRSPNLERVLLYLCNKYFEGDSHNIKEYTIATEALGRSEEFDPKKDSIVRVELHRLRRRLREYYDNLPEEPVAILLPSKSYVPEFQFRDEMKPAVAVGDDRLKVPVRTEPVVIIHPAERKNLHVVAISILMVVALAAVFAFLQFYRSSVQATAVAPRTDRAFEPVVSLPQDEIRIMAGRPPGRYIDRFRQVWEGDKFYKGGREWLDQAEIITRGLDSNIFAGARTGDFTYEIPVAQGTYELQLMFAETLFSQNNPNGEGESARTFNVTVNGKPILRDFDVLADAFDPNTATVRTFRDVRPGADGKVHLQFISSGPNKAFVNGIVLRPGIEGKLRPIRIVCRPSAVRDKDGNLWEPDKHYRGGLQITRPQGAPTEDGEIFRGERYGNFSYIIPVTPGRYQAKLYFWEYWWGEGHPGHGGVGSRLFSVFCNRKPLLVDFDIIKHNPKDQVIVETFDDLVPDAQGKLIFEFVPKVNYGIVNAIEITEQ